mmetsp:Transcript_7469/g.18720  ORF Transcript_7469/g.18720 Transcript_7469/m.18720 type:complete len:129 (+) Transcript_7469:77-463(+)
MGWGGESKGKGSWGITPPQNVFGKGWGGAGAWSKGKGKGKGKRRTDPEKTAWIGGLPENEASVERNKALVEHLKQAGECKFVKIGKSGTGCAAFTTADEVATAIATLNGSVFQGVAIQVDVWTKKEEA